MENRLPNPTGKQWFSLVFCVIAGAIAPFFQYCHGTMADSIMTKYAIDYTHYGYINTAYAIACGVGLFIVGYFVERLGCKSWTMLGIGIMIVGHAIFMFAPTYWLCVASRFISGFGNACIYNAAYTLAMHWFTGTNKLGVAVGGMTAADGIGTFSALFLYAMLVGGLGETMGNVATLAFMIALFIVLCLVLKDPEGNFTEDTSDDEAQSWMYKSAWNRNTLSHTLQVMGVLGGLGIANYYGPIMFQQLGMAESASGLCASLFTVCGIFSGIIFGLISDNMGKRKPTMLVAGIGMICGYILMIIGSMSGSIVILVLGFMLCGFMAYVAYPIGFAVLGDTTIPSKVGAANGIIQGVSFLVGMLAWQQIVGAVKDATDSYWIGLAFCAGLTLITNIVGVIIAKDKTTLMKEAGIKE